MLQFCAQEQGKSTVKFPRIAADQKKIRLRRNKFVYFLLQISALEHGNALKNLQNRCGSQEKSLRRINTNIGMLSPPCVTVPLGKQCMTVSVLCLYCVCTVSVLYLYVSALHCVEIYI